MFTGNIGEPQPGLTSPLPFLFVLLYEKLDVMLAPELLHLLSITPLNSLPRSKIGIFILNQYVNKKRIF
jgi:hypothetical protein